MKVGDVQTRKWEWWVLSFPFTNLNIPNFHFLLKIFNNILNNVFNTILIFQMLSKDNIFSL